MINRGGVRVEEHESGREVGDEVRVVFAGALTWDDVDPHAPLSILGEKNYYNCCDVRPGAAEILVWAG